MPASKKPTLLLDVKRLSSFSDTEWLGDEHIDQVHALLRQQYADIDGLQPVCVFQAAGCQQIGQAGGPFVQILNVAGNHWVTVTNISAPSNTVKVYDSLYDKYPDENTLPIFMRQLAALVAPDKLLKVRWMDVKKQVGGKDCGFFAIASAVHLCEGWLPELCDWDQAAMRDHLRKCLQVGSMTSFPVVAKCRASTGIVHEITEKVYCHCKLPEDKSRFMVQCGKCKDWFHRECEAVPSRVTRKTKFRCKKCL